MEPEVAEREAQAAKYRMRLMLQEIERATTDPAIRTRTAELSAAVKRIQVLDDEHQTNAARRAVAQLEPLVQELAVATDVHFAQGAEWPKWVRFIVWTFPVLLLLVGIGVIWERRRRKSVVDQAAVAALEASGEAQVEERRATRVRSSTKQR